MILPYWFVLLEQTRAQIRSGLSFSEVIHVKCRRVGHPTRMQELVKADLPYERVYFPKAEGLKLFKQMGEFLSQAN